MKADFSNIKKRYDIVYCDPPWWYTSVSNPGNKLTGAAENYQLMTDDELLEMNPRQIMENRSIMFMWATCPRLDFALKCLEAWNLFYRGVAFVWVKTNLDGSIMGAKGVRPSIIKPQVEIVLAASTIQKGRPLPLHDEGAEQLIIEPQTILDTRRGHSEKPFQISRQIELMYPNNSRIELFARQPRERWDVWGNEV